MAYSIAEAERTGRVVAADDPADRRRAVAAAAHARGRARASTPPSTRSSPICAAGSATSAICRIIGFMHAQAERVIPAEAWYLSILGVDPGVAGARRRRAPAGADAGRGRRRRRADLAGDVHDARRALLRARRLHARRLARRTDDGSRLRHPRPRAASMTPARPLDDVPRGASHDRRRSSHRGVPRSAVTRGVPAPPAVISAPAVRHASRAQGSTRARVRGFERHFHELPDRLSLRLSLADARQGTGPHGGHHPGPRHRRERRDLQRRPRRAAEAAGQPRRGSAHLHPSERPGPRRRTASSSRSRRSRTCGRGSPRSPTSASSRPSGSRWSAWASRASCGPASSTGPTST